jgi:hypothetical protein
MCRPWRRRSRVSCRREVLGTGSEWIRERPTEVGTALAQGWEMVVMYWLTIVNRIHYPKLA